MRYRHTLSFHTWPCSHQGLVTFLWPTRGMRFSSPNSGLTVNCKTSISTPWNHRAPALISALWPSAALAPLRWPWRLVLNSMIVVKGVLATKAQVWSFLRDGFSSHLCYSFFLFFPTLEKSLISIIISKIALLNWTSDCSGFQRPLGNQNLSGANNSPYLLKSCCIHAAWRPHLPRGSAVSGIQGTFKKHHQAEKGAKPSLWEQTG